MPVSVVYSVGAYCPIPGDNRLQSTPYLLSCPTVRRLLHTGAAYSVELCSTVLYAKNYAQAASLFRKPVIGSQTHLCHGSILYTCTENEHQPFHDAKAEDDKGNVAPSYGSLKHTIFRRFRRRHPQLRRRRMSLFSTSGSSNSFWLL